MRLLLAGEGHGAQAALRSLSGFDVAICSEDEGWAPFAERKLWFRVPRLEKALADYSPDLIVAAGYKPLVPESILQKHKVLNVHYSLLPRYRGLHAVVWALLNGETEVGWTLHEMDEWVDHGDVIFQEALATERKTSWELMEALDARVERKLGEALKAYLSARIRAKPQEHDRATFVGRRNLEDCRMRWDVSAEYCERFLRALVKPYPLPFFDWRGKRWEIARAEVVRRDYREIPGHLVNRDAESVWIKLADGLLRIFELSESGHTQPATEVLKSLGIRLP